jgi:hypothetical protein
VEHPAIAAAPSNKRNVDFIFIVSPPIDFSREPSFPDVTNQSRVAMLPLPAR